MSETKWTPGPWQVGEYDSVIDTTNTLIRVSGVSQPHGYVPPDDVSYANARLIAAAPELYEALDAIVSLWTLPEASNELVSRMIRDRVMEPAMNALAKARGEAVRNA